MSKKFTSLSPVHVAVDDTEILPCLDTRLLETIILNNRVIHVKRSALIAFA